MVLLSVKEIFAYFIHNLARVMKDSGQKYNFRLFHITLDILPDYYSGSRI